MRLIIAIVVVAVIYLLQYKLYKKYWDKGLLVKLTFSKDVVSCDEKVELVEVIENDKPLALPILNVKFATSRTFDFYEEDDANVSDMYYRNDVFSILGNQRIERRLSFRTTARGVFSIKELQVSSKDLFLKHNFAHIAANDTVITVLPRRLPIKDFVNINERIMGDFEVNRWNNPDPFSFRGIRQYQTYDSMNNINWKASAKMNELMVNQLYETTENELRIYLNLRPYMKSNADLLAEHAISIVSTIAADYASQGIKVSFYTNGMDASDNKVALSAGSGRDHIKTLDILLAGIDISKKAGSISDTLSEGFKDNDGSITHLIISTYRDDEMYNFFEENMTSHSLYWIVPELSGNPVDLRYPGIFRWDV